MTCSHPGCTGKHRTGGTKEGLCPLALWRRRVNQLRRYHERYKQKAREVRRAYYLRHREHLVHRSRDYYRTHRAQMITYATARTREQRMQGITYTPPRATVVTEKEPDRQWWKLTPEETPRRWKIEAAV